MSLDVTSLTMTEIIRLQDVLSRELRRRFERNLALAFSDIVGSTPYFAKYGDEAGRKLQQRHTDLLQRSIQGKADGRIVDTAGDGAFMCFPSVEGAVGALVDFSQHLLADNADRPRDEHLEVRLGVHWGPVLTDGVQMTGDSVNLCARIAGSARAGEMRLSSEAFHELVDPRRRLMCAPLPAAVLKGIPRPVEMVRLDWRDRRRFPDRMRVMETGEEIPLPALEIITFGRLRSDGGVRGNDVVLQLPDKEQMMQISRWHFELRRRPDGLVLRQLSDGVTEVDGVAVARGAELPIGAATVVRVAKAMTLAFEIADELATRGPL